ncbi:MAG: DsbA family protein [gamma proteobacterium symbiont of Bathyaustriella thionipta]|nr:DsbA family protein [gamma proteobacterium symbiont of Bathyaustriella thionipta]
MPAKKLYYIHDPMCSWCWAFRPALDELQRLLPDLEIQKVLGGLAVDSDEPMPQALREQLQQTWKRIQLKVPGIHFNFTFWSECRPRRSTYPACRAVLVAAEYQLADAMTEAIQRAYYEQARNPSDDSTLLELAESLGLDRKRFLHQLNSAETAQALDAQIQLARQLGASSFPTLVYETGGSRWPLAIDYNRPQAMKEAIAGIDAFND